MGPLALCANVTTAVMDRLARPHGWEFYRHAGNAGGDMFKSKAYDSKASENQKTDANATPITPMAVQPTAVRPTTLEADTSGGSLSCIGSGMSIVGDIECNGPAQVFGRIQGEVRASNLVIGEGAQVEGSVIAQDVTVCGSVKGTIRAVRVTLQRGGAVEGDIFHRSLSIDESSLFEGTSRRVENPTDPSLSIDGKGAQKKGVQSPILSAASPMHDNSALLA